MNKMEGIYQNAGEEGGKVEYLRKRKCFLVTFCLQTINQVYLSDAQHTITVRCTYLIYPRFDLSLKRG